MRRNLLREIDEIPKVGERRMEQYIIFGAYGCSLSAPEPCVVTYVNYRHRWYEVYFERLGYSCGYKFHEREQDQRTDEP